MKYAFWVCVVGLVSGSIAGVVLLGWLGLVIWMAPPIERMELNQLLAHRDLTDRLYSFLWCSNAVVMISAGVGNVILRARIGQLKRLKADRQNPRQGDA